MADFLRQLSAALGRIDVTSTWWSSLPCLGRDNLVQLVKAAAILSSVLASAKVNQVEQFADVRDLLVKIAGERLEDHFDLLPDHWLQTHAETQRRWSR